MEELDKDNIEDSAFEAFQFVSFYVGSENYGVSIENVESIVRIPDVTLLPQTEDFIKGIINIRGNIIPVIDMRERFGMVSVNYSSTTRVIVVKINEKLIGMIVDNVSQVIVLNSEQITPAPDVIHGISGEYLDGIGKQGDDIVIILNVEKILTTEEIIEVDQIKLKSPENSDKKGY
ncbi:MAG: purine-binding chemotaxis protein CheW [Spirochaetes bacterium]|nr:purine-binding chemotaxis protein CheW [Spirochaetota bacterium]